MYFLIAFSIILSFLNAFLPAISKSITRLIFQLRAKSCLQNEIEEIKRSMKEISMKDEFPKYAKLQRALNKKREEYKIEVRRRKSSQLGIQYFCQGFLTLVGLAVFWIQSSTPVIILNENWLHPFGGILSWPTHIPGALSFPLWFLVTNTVAKMATILVNE